MAETLARLAELIGANVVGDAAVRIRGVAGLENAQEGDLVFAEDDRTFGAAQESPATAIVVREGVNGSNKPLLQTPDPKYAFSRLLRHFNPDRPVEAGIHPTAVVSESAEIGSGVRIGPNAVIEDSVRIGEGCVVGPGCFVGEGSSLGPDCRLHPNVTIYHESALGARVVVHSGTVIGGDGFGYVCHDGKHEKLLQIGDVVIGEDVEIGANTCIDRASFGSTRVGRGTKIDNQVQIGHNAEIGENCILVAQVGVSGSAKIGNGCVLAGQVGIGNHALLGDGAVVGAQSGIPSGKQVRPGQILLGSPARKVDDFKKMWATLAKLPSFASRFHQLADDVARMRMEASGKDQPEDGES